jgi:CxxC-x17-CxxC domain-containing protein
MAYGSGGFRRGGSSGGGFRRSFGPREMHKITCSECGKEAEVPFKPREGTPVYCKECFMAKKGIAPRAEKKEEAEEEAEESEESEEEASEEEEK